jgi:hypothetical protein
MKYSTLIIAAFLILGVATANFAGDDPSIKGQMRAGIQTAMDEHITDNTVGDRYVIYDAANGELKKLTFKKLHKGIVVKGDFYVSCADFADEQGKEYDIDFLVGKKGSSFFVLESVVHSEGGKKRAYHLEDK